MEDFLRNGPKAKQTGRNNGINVTYCLCSAVRTNRPTARQAQQCTETTNVNVRRANEGNAAQPDTAPACVCNSKQAISQRYIRLSLHHCASYS